MAKNQVVDDGLFTRTESTQTLAELRKDLRDHFENPFTALEWIGGIAVEVARELLPSLVDGAEELPMPGDHHLRKDAPESARDLIVAWENCHTLGQAATREGWLKFDFTNLWQAYYLGAAIQRWHVRPKAPMVKKHQRQVEMLAKARQTRQKVSRDLRKECQAAMRTLKKQTVGSKVSHTDLQGRVAVAVGCSVRTVKTHCPKQSRRK